MGIICLGECRWTDFSVKSFSTDPLFCTHTCTHTHTFRSEGAQIQTLFLPHCYTNRLEEAWGLFIIGVHTYTHIHPGTHVHHPPCRTWGMWKSLGDASAYVSLCPLYVSRIIKGPIVESLCKCIQYLLMLALSLKWNHSLLGFFSRLHNKSLSNHVLHCMLTSVFYTNFKLVWDMLPFSKAVGGLVYKELPATLER